MPGGRQRRMRRLARVQKRRIKLEDMLRSKHARRAVLRATKERDLATLCDLLDHGANPNSRDEVRHNNSACSVANSVILYVHIFVTQHGFTPLMTAAWNGDLSTIALLLSRGADINAQAQRGQTALSHACWQGHEPIVNLLLAAKADANIAQANQETPLMVATWRGHAKIVQQLLRHGADVHAQQRSGATALFMATLKENQAVRTILREHMDTLIRENQAVTEE